MNGTNTKGVYGVRKSFSIDGRKQVIKHWGLLSTEKSSMTVGGDPDGSVTGRKGRPELSCYLNHHLRL